MAWYDAILNRLNGRGSPAKPVANAANAANAAAHPDAYAAIYPAYEVQTPQYPAPNPYNLATAGYRTNEIVYACIQKRAVAASEAQLRVYDGLDSRVRKEISDHPLRQLIRRPNPAMSEPEFWQATEIYKCIAGFACWEIELSNAGQPVALWPMRPDWCAFLRGPGQPIRAVRYQPHGLPAVDVPFERVLTFMEFDPIFPALKGLSKTAVALKTITTDGDVTKFLTGFFQRGAVISGVLKTQQSLQESEARRLRDRWREAHGNGVENWGDIAVLGSGADFTPTQMTFQEMDFTSIDGRDEARICQVFDVPSILIGAKIGLNASTYSNYEQARKAFYENTVFPLWRGLEGHIDNQLMPLYEYSDACRSFPLFDVRDVRALQEDRTSKWARAKDAAAQNLITRDEARTEMGLDAIDNAAVFVGPQPPAVGEVTLTAEERAEQEAETAALLIPPDATEVEDTDVDVDVDITEPEDDEAEAEADALLDEIEGGAAKAAPRDADGDGIINEGSKPKGRDNSLAAFMARRKVKPKKKRKGPRPKKTDTEKEKGREEKRAKNVAEKVAKLEGKRDELRQALIALQGQDDPSNLRKRISQAIERLEKRIDRWKNDSGEYDSGAGSLLREIAQTAAGDSGSSGSSDNGRRDDGDAHDRRKSAEMVLAVWRKAAIGALKAGKPIPTHDDYPDMTAALAECKSAGDVREVFDEFWPRDGDASGVDALVRELHALRVAMEANSDGGT